MTTFFQKIGQADEDPEADYGQREFELDDAVITYSRVAGEEKVAVTIRTNVTREGNEDHHGYERKRRFRKGRMGLADKASCAVQATTSDAGSTTGATKGALNEFVAGLEDALSDEDACGFSVTRVGKKSSHEYRFDPTFHGLSADTAKALSEFGSIENVVWKETNRRKWNWQKSSDGKTTTATVPLTYLLHRKPLSGSAGESATVPVSDDDDDNDRQPQTNNISISISTQPVTSNEASDTEETDASILASALRSLMHSSDTSNPVASEMTNSRGVPATDSSRSSTATLTIF
ncbi:hypothetical protein IAU59_005130 [Kwoniella sp. CBS 9459]